MALIARFDYDDYPEILQRPGKGLESREFPT